MLRTVLATTIAIGIAAVSVACNIKFGLHFGDGISGQIYAALFGLADLMKTMLPLLIVAALLIGHYLRALCGVAMFAAFTILSLTSAAGLYSLTKAEVVADVEAGRASYDLAADELARTRGRLEALGAVRAVGAVRGDLEAGKQHRRWRTTRKCTNATVTPSRSFCDEYKRLEGELATAQEAAALRSRANELSAKIDGMNLNQVMRAADPQAEALARLSGFSADEIRSALAVLVAVVVELGSGLGLWLAMGGNAAQASVQRLEHSAPTVVETTLAASPVPTVPLIAAAPATCSLVSQFVGECIETRQRSSVRAQELYDAYSSFAQENGGRALNTAAFGRAVTTLGLNKKKVGGYVHYCNIRLVQSRGRLGHMANGLLEPVAAY